MKLPGRALMHAFRGVFLARRAAARLGGSASSSSAPRGEVREGARNILFITTDQQRYDALGANGGTLARTPWFDRLAAEGVRYERAHVHNVVCMPSRSTMLTGQHPRTHGVIANGIALPEDAPSVAQYLRDEGGYHTALVGKAHFEPHLDPTLRFYENRAAAMGSTGPWRGFDHVELATHGPMVGHHYAAWLWDEHPEHVHGFAAVLTGAGGGDTHAPEVAHNPIPRELYHTDWVAERTLKWLASLGEGTRWFCWMSFPDPHHPFDPPHDEVKDRIDWRDVPLPPGYPKTDAERRAILADKPRHWLDWYEGRFQNPEGGPTGFRPGALTADAIREVNAMIAVENELIDEACQRVFEWLGARGMLAHTDVVYTSDHGELQGDYGLMFKGPYHTESLLRVPMVWCPGTDANVAPTVVTDPVGHVDLAPTFCSIAGLDVPAWMESAPLPVASGSNRERVITTFDSQFAAVGMHLRTIYRDGWLCTAYEGTWAHGAGKFPLYWAIWGAGTEVPTFHGNEGELYNVRDDPFQRHNLWDDPAQKSNRFELLDDLRNHMAPMRAPWLPVSAPT